jgi:hypothetical protein
MAEAVAEVNDARVKAPAKRRRMLIPRIAPQRRSSPCGARKTRLKAS